MGRIPPDKRNYPRVQAKVKVSFKSLDDVALGYTENISGGGLFLKTNKLVDPNAELELTVELEKPKGSYQVKGKVVRLMTLSNPDVEGEMIYGLGIQFMGVHPEFAKVLQEAISKNKAL